MVRSHEGRNQGELVRLFCDCISNRRGAHSEVQKPHLLNRKEHNLCTKLGKRTEGGGCLGCCGSTRRHTGPKETAR